MNKYITGDAIKLNREKKKLTQVELAEILNVSDKAVSKWETGRGYPDITLLESIADALEISVMELLSGVEIKNNNTSGNMLRAKLYVCPVCGNVIHTLGAATISCCGINLIPLESEQPDKVHFPDFEKVEDEYFVTVPHEMTKEHYISFIVGISDQGFEMIKLYPEGNAEVRIKRGRTKYLFVYCNKHGLFKIKVPRE